MNWITNYVRPKINSMLGRREMPENILDQGSQIRRNGFPYGSGKEPVGRTNFRPPYAYSRKGPVEVLFR